MQVPAVLLPIDYGTRSATIAYYDLSGYKFSAAEKRFLHDEVKGTTNLLEPTFFHKRTKKGKKTMRGLAMRYNIKFSTFQKFSARLSAGGTVYDDPGRPGDLDDVAMKVILSRVKEGVATAKPLTGAELQALIAEEIMHTMQRAGKRILPGTEIEVTDAKRARIEKSLNIRHLIPQPLTSARVAALSDIRLIYRIACIFLAYSAHLPAMLKWNADATTVVVNESGTGETVCYIPDAEERQKIDSGAQPSTTGILLKWMHLCNAAGHSGDLVVIAAVPSMKDGEFFAQQVPGLTGSDQIEGQGWLYCCNSRAGNAALWQHWFLHVLIPTLRRCRDWHDVRCRTADGTLMDTVFSTDGELVILREAFNDNVLNALREAAVIYIKNGPSVTSQHQPADVSDNFRDFKTGMTMVTKKRIDTYNALLRQSLGAYFTAFAAAFSHADTTAEFREKVTCGLEKIVYVMRSKYVTPEKISQGFERCGQHVRHPTAGQPTVNYDKIMARTLAKEITDEELQHMRIMKDRVIEKFRCDGRVTDEFLDELGVVRSPDAVERDQLNSVCRQHCLVINAEATVARYRAWEATRAAPATAAAPVAGVTSGVATEADLRAARKLVDKENQKAEKQRQQKEHADAEKARRAGLSREERKAEDEALRQQKANAKLQREVNKQQKQEEQRERLARAQALVGAG